MRPFPDLEPHLQTRDLEETRAYLAARAIDLQVLRAADRRAALDVRISGVFLGNVWLGYIGYGAETRVRLSAASGACWPDLRTGAAARAHRRAADGDYWLHFPLGGELEAEVDGRRLAPDSRSGLVLSPADGQTLRFGAGAMRLNVALRRAALHEELGMLLGEPPREALRFVCEIPLADGAGRRLLDMLQWAAREFRRHGQAIHGDVAARFERFVAAWLLHHQPSNYSAALRRRDRPVAPRDVKRVVDYIEANLGEPHTLADLVRVAGVPGRTLLKHFKETFGLSPMRYVRDLRLQRVRRDLAAGAFDRVGDAALKWGLMHPGRFAVDYRKRFGEPPSETLARGERER